MAQRNTSAPTCEYISVYLIGPAKVNNKLSEVESKRITLRLHLVPALGKKRLDKIRAREIEQFKAGQQRRGYAPKSINNHLTILRRILALAAEWEIISHVPQFKWLKCPEPEFDFLDFDEADRLVDAADDEWSTMILVAVRTGLRQGELIGLRWEDIDLVSGRLMVRQAVARGVVGTPKSGRKREVPLGEEVLQALKAHRHLRGPLVFCNADGTMLTKGQCKWPLWRACKRAGLRRVGWHVCRHTFASHLVMRGAPLKAVQELMGHATMEMTMRYAHLSPDARRDAVRLLDRRGSSVAASIAQDSN